MTTFSDLRRDEYASFYYSNESGKYNTQLYLFDTPFNRYNFSKLNVIYLANKGAIIYEDSAMKKPIQELPFNADIRLIFRKDTLYQFKYKKITGYVMFKDFCSRYISNKKGAVIYSDKELTKQVAVIPYKERNFEEQSLGRNTSGIQISSIKWNNFEGYIKWDDFFLDY